MKNQYSVRKTAACLAGVLALSGAAVQADSGDKIIVGESVSFAGGTVATWARANGGGKVIWVGLTIPLSLVENPRASPDQMRW
jgi:hypothetical protein